MSAKQIRPPLSQIPSTGPKRPAQLRALLIAAMAGLALSSACSRSEAPAPTGEGATPPATNQGASDATPKPGPRPDFAPISAHGGTASGGASPASGAGVLVETPNARFELPTGWQRVEPSSGMRVAQAVVPGEQGPGELAVFHFGPGMGGGVEANFERWLGQMEAKGDAAPERGELAHNGYRTSWIDARGTLLPSTMGSGPSTPQPGYRLLGAVVEGEGGPWFFKLTGPEATLAASREAFFELLRSFRGV